ncbi:MAG: lyase [Paenibacillaceae bacterium]|nr:lyase [Paenibacillaceae bacterium]
MLIFVLILTQAGPVMAASVQNVDAASYTLVEQANFEDGSLGGFVKLNGSTNVNAVNQIADDENHYLKMTGSGDGDRSYSKTLAAPTTAEQVLVSFDWMPGELTAKTRSAEILFRAANGIPLFRFIKHGDGSIRYDIGKTGIDLTTTQTVTGVTYDGSWLSAQVLFDFEEQKVAFELHDTKHPENSFTADDLDISQLGHTKSISKMEIRGNRAGNFTVGLDNLMIQAAAAQGTARNVAAITTAYENQVYKLLGTTVTEVVYDLPETLGVELSDGSTLPEVPVTWSSTNYNPAQLGTYAFTGLLDVSGFSNVKNDSNVQAQVSVQVVKDLTLPEPDKGAALYTPYAAESFEYPGLAGDELPLNDSAYGNWTYKGTDKPVVRLAPGTSTGNYAELLKKPSMSTGILSKPVSVKQASKLYFEFALKVPQAGNGNTQEDMLAGLYGDNVDEAHFTGIKVRGTQFILDAGAEETVMKDLAGNNLVVDPSTWYQFEIFADFSGETPTHHVRIRQEGAEIYHSGNVPFTLPDGIDGNQIGHISFMNNSTSNPLYIDNIVLRNGVTVDEDFDRYTTGTAAATAHGWSSVPAGSGSVKMDYAAEGSRKYLNISNPSNGSAFTTTLPFLTQGLDLNTDQTIVEFDYKGSKVGSQEIRFKKSNVGFTSIRMTMSKNGVYLETTGKDSLNILKHTADKWYHFKFVINFPGRFYDVYVDDQLKQQGLNFFTSDYITDTYTTTPDLSKTIGQLYLSSGAGSETLALDNIKVYQEERPVYTGLTIGDIPRLQALITGNNKSAKSDALYQLEQIGTRAILPSLQLALGDEQRGVRLTAARILGHFGNEINEDLFHILLDPQTNFFARTAIVNQLTLNGQNRESTAQAVGALLQNGSSAERGAYATILGELLSDAAGAIPELLAQLHNESNGIETRLTLLDALWHIDESRIPLSLWTLGLQPAAESFYMLMNKANDVLAKAGGEAVPALREALASSDGQLRARAASLLGSMGPDASLAVEDLINALHDNVWYVSWEARSALTKIAPQDPGVISALAAAPTHESAPAEKLPVTYSREGDNAKISNGLISIAIGVGKQFGNVISYKKSDGIELYNNNGQYWTSNGANYGLAQGNTTAITTFTEIANTPEMVELSFKTSATDARPYSLDIRYVVRAGEEGYYYYVVEDKEAAYPDAYVGDIATKMRVNPEKFNYRIFADGLQGRMIAPEELEKIAENEIINETYQMDNGDIWAKYSWKAYDLPSSGAFGFTGSDKGIWVVQPAIDNGGSLLQDYFGAGHETYDEPVMIQNIDQGFFVADPRYLPEKKVLGPYFMYANTGANSVEMWVDAKRKAEEEKTEWPYNWITDSTYFKDRGSIAGKIVDTEGTPVYNATVVVCYPDPNMDYSWQNPFGANYYIAHTGLDGAFSIPKAAPGNYTLFAFADGVYGEIRKEGVTVQADHSTDVGALSLVPKKLGELVWQIGTPDRSGREFKGGSNNRVFDKFLRYAEFFPNDVNYTVGVSQPGEDFFFWHPADTLDGKRPVYTIHFNLDQVPQGKAALTLGFSSTRGDVVFESAINGTSLTPIPFDYDDDTGASMRGAEYGIYRNRVLTFDASLLKEGSNTLTLNLSKVDDWLKNVGYDFIRLEFINGDSPDLFPDLKARWAESDGSSAGSQYDPAAAVSRAEWIAMVARATGLTDTVYLGAYDDVAGEDWYAGAVQSGRYKQLIAPELISGNNLSPAARITREELSSVVMKAYEYRLKTLPGFDLSGFADSGNITDWAKKYVQAGLAMGIVKAKSDTEIAPQAEITRTEALATAQRLAAAFSWLPLVAPEQPASPEPQLVSLHAEPDDTSLTVGDTQSIKVTGTYEDGSTIELSGVQFISRDTAVAEVSTLGVITANAAGQTVIDLTYEGKQTSVKVQVVARSGGGTGEGDGDEDEDEDQSTSGVVIPTPSTPSPRIVEVDGITIGIAGEDSGISLDVKENKNSQTLQNAHYEALSPIYTISVKDGKSLSKPITLTLAYDATRKLEGKPSIFRYDASTGKWVDIGGEAKAGIISAASAQAGDFAVLLVKDSPEKNGEQGAGWSDLQNHWAKQAIAEAAAKGIIDGYPDSTFRPDQTVNRLEFAIMLARALKLEPKPDGELKAADADRIPNWAISELSSAVAAGILEGYDDGTLQPERTISRTEMVVMLLRAYEWSGNTIKGQGTEKSAFHDTNSIPDWAKADVAAAVEAELIQGDDNGLFRPAATATRAEAVTVLMRMLGQGK